MKGPWSFRPRRERTERVKDPAPELRREHYRRAIFTDDYVRLERALGDTAFCFAESSCRALTLEADGAHAWSWHEDNTLLRWDLATGAQVSRTRVAAVASENVCWSRDHARIAVAERDGRVAVYEPGAGRLRYDLQSATAGRGPRARLYSYSPDRLHLVGDVETASGTPALRVWDLRNKPSGAARDLPLTLPCRGCALYLPDGRGLIVGTLDAPMQVAKLDASGGFEWRSASRFEAFTAASTPAGDVVFVAGRGVRAGAGYAEPLVVALDARTGAELWAARAGWDDSVPDALWVSADGARVWSLSSVVECFSTSDGAVLARAALEGMARAYKPEEAPLGARVAMGVDEGRVWFPRDHGLSARDVRRTVPEVRAGENDPGAREGVVLVRGEALPLGPHGGAVRKVWVDPTGARALAVGDDGSLRVWDLRAGRSVWNLEGLGGPAVALACTPDLRFALAARGTKLLAWDLTTGLEAFALSVAEGLGGGGDITALCVSHDGASCAAAYWSAPGEGRTTMVYLRSWDLTTQEVLAQSSACYGIVPTSLRFDEAGGTLIASSAQGWFGYSPFDGGQSIQAVRAATSGCVAVSRRGAYAVRDGGVHTLVERRGGEAESERTCMQTKTLPPATGPLEVAARAEYAVSGAESGAALLWNLARGLCAGAINLPNVNDRLSSVAIAAGGATVVLGTVRGMLLAFEWDHPQAAVVKP